MTGPSEFTTETETDKSGFSIKITREPNDAPDDTYFGAAKQIEDVPPEGRDGMTRLQVVEAIIKRFGHYEKLGAYEKIDRYFDAGPEFIKNIIKVKIETHSTFSTLPLDSQISGRGKWKE